MKQWLFLLLLPSLLLLSSCKDPQIERISHVEKYAFGQLPADIFCDGEKYIVRRELMTPNDFVELHITPRSRQIWRIELIFTEVPGQQDPLDTAKKFVEQQYHIEFKNSDAVTLPGTVIQIADAFDRSHRGVRCTFTDVELEKLFQQENSSAETAELRKKERARQDIFILEDALRQYNLDTDTYPDSLTGLLKNDQHPRWNGPYIDLIPADPWGKAYLYRRHEKSFQLYSTGSDGKSEIR